MNKTKHEKSDGSFRRLLESLVDTVLILLGYYLAFQLRYGFNPASRNLEPFEALLPLIALLAMGLLFFNRLYIEELTGRLELGFRLVLSLGLLGILTMAAAFADRGFAFPRSIFALAFLIQTGILYVWKSFRMHRLWEQRPVRTALVLGPPEETAPVSERIQASPHLGLRAQAVPSDSDVQLSIDSPGVLILCPGLAQESRSRYMEIGLTSGWEVFVVPDYRDILLNSAGVRYLEDKPVLYIRGLTLSLEQQFLKRAMDLVLGTLLLLAALLPMALMALRIRLHDGGPALFRQERLSRYGKRFILLKFRTMVQDAEKETGPVLAEESDGRLLPFGARMRERRLDELPQLINVLKGEMSLVGPRPERPELAEMLEENIEGFTARLMVKAGLTGLAQIQGRYDTRPEDKLNLDLMYIRRYSPLLDLWILAGTIRTVLKKEQGRGVRTESTGGD